LNRRSPRRHAGVKTRYTRAKAAARTQLPLAPPPRGRSKCHSLSRRLTGSPEELEIRPRDAHRSERSLTRRKLRTAFRRCSAPIRLRCSSSSNPALVVAWIGGRSWCPPASRMRCKAIAREAPCERKKAREPHTQTSQSAGEGLLLIGQADSSPAWLFCAGDAHRCHGPPPALGGDEAAAAPWAEGGARGSSWNSFAATQPLARGARGSGQWRDSQSGPEAASAVLLCASVAKASAAGSPAPAATAPADRRAGSQRVTAWSLAVRSQDQQSIARCGQRRPAVRLPHAWPDRRSSGRRPRPQWGIATWGQALLLLRLLPLVRGLPRIGQITHRQTPALAASAWSQCHGRLDCGAVWCGSGWAQGWMVGRRPPRPVGGSAALPGAPGASRFLGPARAPCCGSAKEPARLRQQNEFFRPDLRGLISLPRGPQQAAVGGDGAQRDQPLRQRLLRRWPVPGRSFSSAPAQQGRGDQQAGRAGSLPVIRAKDIKATVLQHRCFLRLWNRSACSPAGPWRWPLCSRALAQQFAWVWRLTSRADVLPAAGRARWTPPRTSMPRSKLIPEQASRSARAAPAQLGCANPSPSRAVAGGVCLGAGSALEAAAALGHQPCRHAQAGAHQAPGSISRV